MTVRLKKMGRYTIISQNYDYLQFGFSSKAIWLQFNLWTQ